MILKWIFDRVASLLELLILWPVLLVVAILIKVKMPGGPVLFVQKRVGKDGKLFDCHKFRTMRVQSHTASTDNTEKAIPNTNDTTPSTGSGIGSASTGWSTVSLAGDSRITPLGAKLRHWKPMHKQPVYKDCVSYLRPCNLFGAEEASVSEALFKVGMCLPSGPYVTDEDVKYIVETIKGAII